MSKWEDFESEMTGYLQQMLKDYDGKTKKPKIEMRYYISSLLINIELFSKSIRNHWSVENKLHWHLDFTFKQDNNSTTNKKALFKLELVNKFCLGIFNRIKPFFDNISIRRIRKIISQEEI